MAACFCHSSKNKMDDTTLIRILAYLSDVILLCEEETDEIVGVYVEIDGDLYSWNGQGLVLTGKADDLLRRDT